MSRRFFTLVEILLAMAIFVFAVGPILGVLATGSGLHSENVKRVQAQMLASQIRAQLQIYAMKTKFDNPYMPTDPNNLNSGFDNYIEPATGLAQSDRYRGLHYVLIGEREAAGLVQFKLGISFRPPEDTQVASTYGGTVLTLNNLTSFQKSLYSTGSNLYQQRISSNTNGGIFSSSARTPGAPGTYTVAFDRLTKTSNSVPYNGTTYLLDYVFTLWVAQ